MVMRPRVRKLALLTHVVTSIGWLGAVVVFLALTIVGLTSSDERVVRGVFLAMEPAAWAVLVPLAFGSLLTGLIQSLGTTWGLFRHYWVVAKLVINLACVGYLLLYMGTFRQLAETAATSESLDAVRNSSPRLHALLAAVLLLIAAVLAVYKPKGLTHYGQRKQWVQQEQRRGDERSAATTLADSGPAQR